MSELATVTVVEQETTVVQVSDTELLITVSDPTQPAVEINTPGIAGPAGPSGGAGYTHTQSVAAATWIVNHNLGRFPQVTVVDNSGVMVITDLIYGDANNLTLVFASSFAGKAYLQ
jgi:hypothetical protein